MSKPLVSVCIVTYQHARFIAQAVDCALTQKTTFPYEILIGEDESTDGTRDICLAYAQHHPDRVRVFLRQRCDVVNIDGRPRGSFNLRMTLREAKGEFVALCEGDDFWTDPEKLQRQVDYLRANPDCVGCFHDAKLVDADGQTLRESYFQSDQEKFSQWDVLETLLSREPTCSLMFRKAAFAEPLPEWYLRRPSDLYLDILLTEHGSLGFVRRNMGAYRKHAGGVWGGEREANQIIELIIRYKLLLTTPYFLDKYRNLLLRKLMEFQSSLFTRDEVTDEIKRLAEIVKEQSSMIEVTQRERDRLAAETKATQMEVKRATKDAQKHIDALKSQLERTVADHQQTIEAQRSQLDRLAATSHQQAEHIAILNQERERLIAEKKSAFDEAKRAIMDAQRHIDELLAQLKRLAATSEQQADYIAVLTQERDRLTALTATQVRDCEHYVKVINEQSAYIRQLEQQRHPGSTLSGT